MAMDQRRLPEGCEPIWTEFRRKLTRRLKLVSNAHEGLKAPFPRAVRNMAGVSRSLHEEHAGLFRKSGRRVVSDFIAAAFGQEMPEFATFDARRRRSDPAERAPKLAAVMDDAKVDVLAYMSGAPRSLASSPTATSSSPRVTRSCSSRAMDGPCSAPNT